MALRVVWTSYGREAASALRAAVAAAKGGEPLAPVTVVVPSNHVGVAARRLLASGVLGPASAHGVGLVAVSFVTLFRLAELLAAPLLAGEGRRPVSTPVVAAAVRSALNESSGVFAPVAAHAATEAALVSTYRELREVSADGLDALSNAGQRARDVVRLHRSTRAKLAPGWYDEQDLMAVATAELLEGSARTAVLGDVVVHLPQALSPHQRRLLAAATEVSSVTVIAALTGDARADAEVVDSVLALGADGLPLAPPSPIVSRDRTVIVLASDADEEVRVAVRAVLDAVDAGVPLDRIALLYGAADPYARIVHEHLRAAGVATNGPAVTPLAGRSAGLVLLELLALPERSYRRQDVLGWLTVAPARWRGARVPLAVWERLSRAAGVVAGHDDWDIRLARHAEGLEGRAAELAGDTDEPAVAADYWRAEARRARDLRAFVLDLIGDLEQAAAAVRSWSAQAAWARAHLDRFTGGPSERMSWPDDERRAAERVEVALQRLAALDGVEGPVSLDVFTRTLALELDNDLGRVGRFGDGVFVAPVALGIGLDVDLVAVVGLAEGTFPSSTRDDSLLPDDDRRATGGDLPLRRAGVDRQHRQLLATLAAARRQVLGVPRGDLRRSTERVPSRWVLDVASALAGRRWWTEDLLGAEVVWVRHIPSFSGGLRDLVSPATAQEHRLRALLVAAPGGAADLVRVADDGIVNAGAAVVEARRSARFTRFDGNLATVAVPSPTTSVTSATRLEAWSSCPFHYFVQNVLGVRAVDNPEDALQVSPLDRGVLVHHALERFVAEVLARPGAEQPGPDDGWTAADHARLREIAGALVAQFEASGLTGRALFWRRDRERLLAELDRFLDEDDRLRREHRARLVAAELAFGAGGAELAPVPVELPDGRVLRFQGKADRIDRSDDGTLHVLDYKTGKRDRYRTLSEADPDQRGTRLQLVVYGAAARQYEGDPTARVQADYWFVTPRGGYVCHGYEVTDEVMAKASASLATINDGIERGVFVSRPTSVSSSPFIECHSCDPDGLGATELRRAWDRKRDDPALYGYSEFAEPDLEVAGEGESDDG